MSKNIALFIDGTWNKAADEATRKNTNVHKLFLAADNQPDQLCEHLNGIGTDVIGRWLRMLPNVPRNIIGGLFGLGMSARIKDAYQFLSANYLPGDSVFLFGFSRGAFAARSVAGFVDAVGLLLKDVAHDYNRIEEAYAAYENADDPEHSRLKDLLRDLSFSERPSAEEGTLLPIHFLGVWDTVAALGLPGRTARFCAKFTEFHKTSLPSNVRFARHALALHELRPAFRASLWHDKRDAHPRPRLQQMWFPGAHADVGGGYRDSGWSDVALNWMAAEASDCGLKLGKLLPATGSGIPGKMIHNSIRRVFALVKPKLRDPLSNPYSVDPETRSTFDVHPIAVQRLLVDEHTRYTFWRADVKEKLTSADLSTIRMLASLGVVNPDAERVTAINEFWEADPWTVERCREEPSRFVEAIGLPTDRERKEFVRSLLFHVVLGRDPFTPLLATMDAAVRRSLLELNAGMDMTNAEVLRSRLSEIVALITSASVVFPDASLPNLESLLDEIESKHQFLLPWIRVARIRDGDR